MINYPFRGGRNWQALLEKTKRTSEEFMQVFTNTLHYSEII